jgi:hypothetical protein
VRQALQERELLRRAAVFTKMQREQLLQRSLGSAGCRLLAAVGVGASLEQLSEALGLGADQLAACFATDLHRANLSVIWERLGI